MKSSILDPIGMNVAFWRALLPAEGFVLSEPTPSTGAVRAWWGGPYGVRLDLEPGDRLFLFTTPWGPAFEGVVRAEESDHAP